MMGVLKRFKSLRLAVLVTVMIIVFSFSSVSQAVEINLEDGTEKDLTISTYSNTKDIEVGKSNGREYRTIKDLHLRSGNGNSYDSIIVMKKGSYVKHLGTVGDNIWFKVDFAGKVGFVNRNDVTSKANYDINYCDIKVSKSNGREYRTIKDLPLRSGNGDSYHAILVMEKGSHVKHLGTAADDSWFKLDYNGEIGFVHRNDVTSKENYEKNYDDTKVEGPSIEIEVSESNGREYRTIKDLHLRSGNGDSYDSIVLMEKGSYVKHLGTAKDKVWFKLDFDGKVGYVNRNDVTSKANYEKNYDDTKVEGPSIEIEVGKANGKEYRVTTNLNLREGNSTAFNQIMVIPEGSYVKHLGTTNNSWFKVDYKGSIGYIHSNYVVEKVAEDDIEVSESNGMEYRTIKDLHLRSGNGDSYDSIVLMEKGSYVKHLGTTKDDIWFKIDYKGQEGYIFRGFVTTKANYDMNYAIEVSKSDGRVYSAVLDLHLRNGNSYSHDSLEVIPNGGRVKHLGTTDNDWFKVEYNGIIGYVHRRHVTYRPNTPAKKHMVFLDYGHGGIDPGAIGTGGRQEKDDALRVGLLVAKNLRANGIIVNESRTGDISGRLELIDRANMANREDHDYFVSIHRNAFNGKAYGMETFHHRNTNEKSKALATVVQKNLVGVGFFNRGVKQANFSVLRNSKAPAILVEIGFIDNPSDNKIFDSKLNQIAKAISDGIISELAKK